ncbi:MAG: amino acid ABC transporter substrate-binding protein [Oscillospiraceae bacterium]|nr:amino acid ABC transporter substrate-binding protein [Oscillospiraceae bacterium]
MFKKIAAIVLSVLMLCACLTACGGDTKDNAPKVATLESVKAAGKLTIATSPDFPPFEELNADGTVTGIEIDILNTICEKLGVKLDIVQMDFDSVLPGVQTGKYDVGVSGISVTPAREKNVKFTKPYCLAAQAIVVLEGSEIKAKADLTGKKVSVQSGTTAESFCLENNYQVSAFKANADAQTAMVSGKVAAWVIDDLTAAEMVAAYNEGNPEKKLVILEEAMTTEPYAFAFHLASGDLVDEINKILEGLVADGTVAKLFEKYNAPYTSPVK